MRNFLAFVLALFLGGAVVLVLQKRQAEERTAEHARELEERRSAEAPPTPEEPGAEPAPSSAPRRPAAKPAPESAHAAPLPTTLTGALTVLDEKGTEHASEDGILALTLGVAGSRTRHEIGVRGGRWSLPLGPERAGERRPSVVVGPCLLGTRIAAPAPGQAAELALPPDGRLDLRLCWPSAPRLHVRARDGGRELGEVLLYELPAAQRGSPLDRQHPGPGAAARAAGPSPVTLEPDPDFGATRVVFAKSPGYAWGRIELEAGQTEPTLTLDPAGALELAVVGEPELATLEILLLAAEPPHAEVLDLLRGDTKTFRLEDLRAGRYRAEARHSGLLAGTLDVEVVAGQRVQAVLEVARPTAADVPLEGVLVLPEEYGTDDFMLEFLLQGRFDGSSLSKGSFEIRFSAMKPEPGATRGFRWSAPTARPGRYRILLSPHLVAELDSGPSGTRDARIEVRPPALVSLRCVDARTGADVRSEKLAFHTLSPRAPCAVAASEGAGGALEFRVPAGPLLITTTPAQYEPITRLVELGPGANEIVLALRRQP
jgi:hypothetical protein